MAASIAFGFGGGKCLFLESGDSSGGNSANLFLVVAVSKVELSVGTKAVVAELAPLMTIKFSSKGVGIEKSSKTRYMNPCFAGSTVSTEKAKDPWRAVE